MNLLKNKDEYNNDIVVDLDYSKLYAYEDKTGTFCTKKVYSIKKYPMM